MRFSFALTLLVASSSAINMGTLGEVCAPAPAPAPGCVVEGTDKRCDCPPSKFLLNERPKCVKDKEGDKCHVKGDSDKACKCPKNVLADEGKCVKGKEEGKCVVEGSDKACDCPKKTILIQAPRCL